jgi:hypothetical protein
MLIEGMTRKYTKEDSKLWNRLSQQLSDKDVEDATELAKNILIRRGHLNNDGSDTYEGRVRGNMSAADRAKDRAVKSSGGLASDYEYNSDTNYAYKKHRPLRKLKRLK